MMLPLCYLYVTSMLGVLSMSGTPNSLKNKMITIYKC